MKYITVTDLNGAQGGIPVDQILQWKQKQRGTEIYLDTAFQTVVEVKDEFIDVCRKIGEPEGEED